MAWRTASRGTKILTPTWRFRGRRGPCRPRASRSTMKQIEAFAKYADKFCSWTESLQKNDTINLDELLILLSEMLNTALLLPIIDAESVDEDTERLTHDEWTTIHKKISSLPFQYYYEIFDPHDFEDKEPVTGDLHDDLADIYRDIKPGVILYQKGFISDAAFEWKLSFGTHWGEHILSAMRAIYMFER